MKVGELLKGGGLFNSEFRLKNGIAYLRRRLLLAYCKVNKDFIVPCTIHGSIKEYTCTKN